MKVHHAAALALMGWVLVVPPELMSSPAIKGGDNYMMENLDTGWNIVYRYKNAEECANGLSDLLSHKELLADYAARRKKSLDGAEEDIQSGGFCVREDDPRLKRN